VEAVDASHRVISARLRHHEENCYEFILETSAVEGNERPVMVSLGDGREQRFAPILRSSQVDSVLTVWTPSHWHPRSDRRSKRRYPVLLPCRIRADQASAPGRCLDISLSGAAIETEFWHPSVFLLDIVHQGGRVSIPCRTVSVQLCGPMTIVHAQFVDAPESPKSAIAGLVNRARGNFLDAQLLLLGRANDGIQPLR